MMYRAKLKRDLDRWTDMGLISKQAAEAMIEDHDGRAGNFNIGGVLLMLSAVLVSAAILLLVAANWQAIPRLVKVSCLILLIWGFHGGAAFCLAQGRQASGHALLVLGAASFGAALSLVGQLYHLSGDLLDLVYLWIGMASLSCVLFRSGAMAAFVGVLALGLAAATLDQFDFSWTPETVWTPPLLAALVTCLALFTGNIRVQHISGLLILGWLGWIYAEVMQSGLAMVYVALGVTAFAASALPLLARYMSVQIAGFHGLLLAAMGLFILNIDYDHGLSLALVAVTAVGISIVALVLRGRHDGVVRALAYLIFAGEILYLSFTTIDSLLGTSGFFLIAGVIVALLALGVSQMEKLLGTRKRPMAVEGRGRS
ncbi:DUF2157 domain-containing protein [Agrobacterium vitis]|uniref:DUF2157 domain-containing protein n=2 Tax=Agrobacterium vitis TaxID=373 RepID=A0AAE5AVH8_AGRVI|nr:DUF2157 domain-containing protein [Agrobacterium vitis]MCF1496913.1 DUF2157 domain-containing protein [Allorhizobium sp. Av2]MUZ57112.1 DUF2157 domain-containing protein [Agrobacterium vitis]MVA65421.1 DUF2157 domain-containing protein [Agrobacterium vitis]MVA86446.1 DUF2157 domain-containing protein [Agrobacterium vitis]